MRKLVTVRKIADLRPIPNADFIEVATVDGWQLVVKKGEFSVGDSCVYFEIDSFLPESDPRYSFLMKNGVRTFEGERGHKLRTVKLRGQISQGLALPTKTFPELSFNEDDDLSETLGIKKWEPTIPLSLAGQVKGTFPSFIEKTDQERCQNLVEVIFDNPEARYEVSMKLDGCSCTFFVNDGELGVCSRNLELKINDENKDNTLIRVFHDQLFNVALPSLKRNIAIQGEIMGPGVQGNREGFKKHRFFIFDIFDIDNHRYVSHDERVEIVEKLRTTFFGTYNMEIAPILYNDVTLGDLGITDLNSLLQFAEGPSINHKVREGVVFKRIDGQFSFKAISNKFLLKEKD